MPSFRSGGGDSESALASLYFTQINEGGSYFNFVFKLGRLSNDYTVYDSYKQRIAGETASTGISIGAEYGKKIKVNKEGVYIEPQVQLTYGYLSSDNYTLSNGSKVHAYGVDSLIGRVGFNFGWDISPRANVYVKANLLHEFLGDYEITMTADNTTGRKSGSYSDTWFTYGLGASLRFGNPAAKNANFFYFDVERSSGGDIEQEWVYNAGFRFEI